MTSEAVNISLSSDGRWLVVCLTDLSCEVYNATNFSTGHVSRNERAIVATEDIALFAMEDSFYVGSAVSGGSRQRILLGQYMFGENNSESSSRSYTISRPGFVRNFYSGGFVRGNNTYYFATDNGEPSGSRNVKVMRVCHNSDFSALYELALTCGGRRAGSNTRISGVSVVDNFAGMSGPTVVLSTNRQPLPSSQNAVCLYSLDAIDFRMQERFNLCAAATSGIDDIELSWRNEASFCSGFSVSQQCIMQLLINFNKCMFSTS